MVDPVFLYYIVKNINFFLAAFELQSFGPGIIRIKNLATNYYLTIKKNGLFTGNVSTIVLGCTLLYLNIHHVYHRI